MAARTRVGSLGLCAGAQSVRGVCAASLALAVAALGFGCRAVTKASGNELADGGLDELSLPAPQKDGVTSLEKAIGARRSQRAFAPGPLSAAEIGQLLWAAQGITDETRALRAAPSAGALYPLELYVLNAEGTWHYVPARHRLQRVATGDRRSAMAHAAFDQPQVSDAAADLVITGLVARTRTKYGNRAERYVQLEAGHAAQNALLEATALNLAAVPVGAFDDDDVRRTLGLGRAETPLYVLCIGRAVGTEAE